MKFLATPPYDGAFSEYVTMPAQFAFPVPDSISDDAAALLERAVSGRRRTPDPDSRHERT